jgi:hypothetical protein
MYKLIKIDGNVTAYEYHEDGTYTVEEAENMLKYGTVNPTDQQLNDLEAINLTFRNNKDARKYLADTDWYVTRKTEIGTEIPLDISTKRQEARDKIVENP